MPAVFADASPSSLRSIASYAADSHIGGVVLLKGNVAAARSISDTLRSLSAAPPFIAIDAEWGLAMRLKDTPKFPKNGQISRQAEENLLYEYGAEVAGECRQVGINMVLGPVLDVLPAGGMKGASDVIGNRSYGSDPVRVADLGVAYAHGLEDGGVLSVAKHFPGHGAADADSHTTLPVISKSLRELEACDLLPFRKYIDNALSCVMIAHVRVDAMDPSGMPASVSRKVMTDVLRKEYGLQGLAVTDAMNMAGADGFSGADAVIAGADIVLAPASTEDEVRILLSAVRDGRFSLDALKDRVRRILFYKYFTLSETDGGGFRTSPEAARVAALLAE